MTLSAKLQLKPDQPICALNVPDGVDLGIPTSTDPGDVALLLFVRDRAELEATGGPFFPAAAEDRLAWLAYPKAGQPGTDLNRDILWKLGTEKGVRSVRNVSIDGVWSALRFRPE
jgi:hypothetical protein